MKFRFRLEKSLNFTKLKESTKKMEIASTLSRIQNLQDRRKQLEGNIRDILGTRIRRLAVVSDWAAYDEKKVVLDKAEIARVDTSIVEESETLEEQRYQLMKLTMKRKALEALREKRLAEHKLLESRREQKALDEVFRLSSRIRGERES